MNLETQANSMNGTYQTTVGGRNGGSSREKSFAAAQDQFASDLLKARQELRASRRVGGSGGTRIPVRAETVGPIKKVPVRSKIGPVYETLPVYRTKGVVTPYVSDEMAEAVEERSEEKNLAADIGSASGRSYIPATTLQPTAARRDNDIIQYNGKKNLEGLATNRTNAYILSDRPKLTDSELYEMGRKYNFRNMTQDSYDAFLDDLVDKGVLTRAETEYFGYGGTVREDPADSKIGVMRVADWEFTYSQNTPFLENGVPGSGNMVAWLKKMIPGVDWGDGSPEANERVQQRMEMYGALIDVVFCATGTPYEIGRNVPEGYGTEEPDIIDQILDPNSDFYRDMYLRMKVQMEESEEEKKKQAIIDALDAILESISAKKDDWRKKSDTASSMAELCQVIDSLDKIDPRKEQLNLLRERLQNLGIYIDLDVGVKDKDKNTWGTTLTQQLIREEAKDTEPSIFDII